MGRKSLFGLPCLYKQQNPARILVFPLEASETCPDTPGPARSEAAEETAQSQSRKQKPPDQNISSGLDSCSMVFSLHS